MPDETKLYGVSTGNGNNGVSHMFADYYVKTNDPWRLARLAALSQFKPGSGQAWAERHVEIDGDEESTIEAMFLNPPCETTADGEYPDSDDDESEEDGRNYSDGNGAWLLVDVFPEDSPREGKMIYDSLEEAFSAELLALAPSRLA